MVVWKLSCRLYVPASGGVLEMNASAVFPVRQDKVGLAAGVRRGCVSGGVDAHTNEWPGRSVSDYLLQFS